MLPCLILDSTLGNPALSQIRNLLLAPLFGFGTVALGIALALATRPLHGLKDRAAARTFAVSGWDLQLRLHSAAIDGAAFR
ncbi:MAG: hypothetical protein V9H26_29385 [Verrucomicrobiota bacterium]